MITRELIDPNFPVLKPDDPISRAIEISEDFKLTHLLLVDEDEYMGLLTESQLFDAPDDSQRVDSIPTSYKEVFCRDTIHYIDALRILFKHKIPITAILDENDKFEGVISFESLYKEISGLTAFDKDGGIVVIHINEKDYSLSELSRIIESNGSKIIAAFVKPSENEIDHLTVTLKLNTEDLSRIMASLERYEYNIIASFHKTEVSSTSQERLGLLFKYLDI